MRDGFFLVEVGVRSELSHEIQVGEYERIFNSGAIFDLISSVKLSVGRRATSFLLNRPMLVPFHYSISTKTVEFIDVRIITNCGELKSES